MKYRTKLTLILLAVVGITGGVLLWFSHRSAEDAVLKLIQEKVLAIAVTAAPQIDGDAHERITREDSESSNAGRDDENEDYVTVRRPMREARDANRPRTDLDHELVLPVRFIYTFRPRTDGERDELEPYEFVVDAEEEGKDKSYIGDIMEIREGKHLIPPWGKAHVDSEFATDEYGTFLSAFAPVKNSKGENVALLGVDLEAKTVIAQTRNLFYGGLLALGLAVLVAAGASIFLSGQLTAPLMKLEEGVTRIGAGDLNTRVSVDTEDEFGVLGDAINQMAEGLQEREAFKGALVRFVSSQEPVLAEQPDATIGPMSRRVTVLVAELREFESVSKTLPANKVFSFLSDWYSTVIDVILDCRGSLEKSKGEIVTATFGAPLADPDQERHAIESALTIKKEFANLLKRWEISGDSGVSVGVVIHSGTVNVSDRDEVQMLEYDSLSRIIGAVSIVKEAVRKQPENIIISEASAEGLKGTIPLNYLQSIEVPGTGEMLSLHSVAMPDDPGS